jgi:TonB family protein
MSLMSRLEKKCLMASGGMHGFLVLLLIFGSAFFTAKKTPTPPMLNVVPTRLVDAALAGGGGNPNLTLTQDRIKGDTLNPITPPAQPEQPKPRTPPKREEPDPPKVETPKKPDPVKPPPKEVVKEPVKAADEPKRSIISELKTIEHDTQKQKAKEQKAKEEAEAREAREAAKKAANARAEKVAAVSAELQKALSGSLNRIKTGFNDGVAVDVGGPGGEAFADYKMFVQMAYDNAWIVTPELTDESYVALIRVTIARSGRIIAARIIKPSGSSTMDRSVQKAMDRVRADGLPPFPPGAPDSERSFTIEFNLKSKNRTG